MGGFIILTDGRACAPANWAYDEIVRSVAEELGAGGDDLLLKEWLRGQLCEVLGPGMGYVDVRELTPRNRQLFRDAANRAFKKSELVGPIGWENPSFFPAWLGIFRRLLEMWDSVDRGEPPEALNDLRQPCPPTDEKSGPGWHAD
jgi:hypothetical protein